MHKHFACLGFALMVGLPALAPAAESTQATQTASQPQAEATASTPEETVFVDFKVGGVDIKLTEATHARAMANLSAREIEDLRNAPIPANWGDHTALVESTLPDGSKMYADPDGVLRSVMFAVPTADGGIRGVCVTNPVELATMLYEWVEARAAINARNAAEAATEGGDQ
jgi:hypothetical protein